MNIFKILASGDGSINEPNVSAFLAYLINPKASHGLNDELLQRLLNYLKNKNIDKFKNNFPVLDKNGDIRNMDINSDFEIDVLMEQAFYSNYSERKDKTIVDIVLLVFSKNSAKLNVKKETLAHKLLITDNKKVIDNLKQIVLIEVKIKDSSSRELQLEEQYKNTIKKLEELKIDNPEKKLSLIYIAPDKEKSNTNYDTFVKSFPEALSVPVYWNTNDKNDENKNIGLSQDLKDILKDEQEAAIEPIAEYTKQTIKSFITFIDNDFRSSIEEELEGVKNKPRKEFKTEDEFFEFHRNEKGIPDNIIDIGRRISDYINEEYAGKLIHRYSPTHYSFFLKEFNYKLGTKLASVDLHKDKIELLFNKKNILSVKDKVIIQYNEDRYPNTIIYMINKMTKEIECDIKILLNASCNSIVENNKN